MKIGIFTFHRATNAGANLQAFAFQHFLVLNGFNSEFVDYIPNSEVSHETVIKKVAHTFKSLINPKSRKITKKAQKYEAFQKKFLCISDEKYCGDNSILNKKLDYDVLISGSDQIFNLSLSKNSIAYYLPFNYGYKFSYASSFGRENISDEEKNAIIKYLPSFDDVSFRETSGYEIVSQLNHLTKKNIVVDPVFLIDVSEWEKFTKTTERKKFIFAYIMEASEAIQNTLEWIYTKFPELNVFILYGSNCKLKLSFKHKILSIVDPIDFLSLVKNSEFNVTNSFHGLALSLIFRKKVYCCAHTSRNTRINNLLAIIHQEHKLITNTTNDFSFVDSNYDKSDLENMISFSRNYVLNNLNVANKSTK